MTAPTLSASIAGKIQVIQGRGNVQILRALAAARGDWITPKSSALRGATLNKHACELRRRYSLPIESETIQSGATFFNRHRLPVAISIDGGDDA